MGYCTTASLPHREVVYEGTNAPRLRLLQFRAEGKQCVLAYAYTRLSIFTTGTVCVCRA